MGKLHTLRRAIVRDPHRWMWWWRIMRVDSLVAEDSRFVEDYSENELRAMAKRLGMTKAAYEDWPIPKLVSIINNALDMRGESKLEYRDGRSDS